MELQDLQTVRKTVGAKQTMKALQRGEIALLFTAADGDTCIVEPLLTEADRAGVPAVCTHTMEELGKACKIKVKAAAVGVLR